MRLENFLFFFELELGGTIIGYYHFVIYFLSILAAIIVFILAAIYSEDINLIFLGLGIIVSIICLCFLIHLSWELIWGVEKRDHHKVQKFRLLCIVGLIFNIILVVFALTQTDKAHLNGYHITVLVVYLIVSFATQVYIYFVVDSLYNRFKEEAFLQSMAPPPVFSRVV